MISSALYFICFAVLLLIKEKGIRVIALAGMAHILIENYIYYWFLNNIYTFDINLYLTLCWFLDITFVFISACVLVGWKKKVALSVAIPVLFCQMIVMQYPFLIPSFFSFVIEGSYQTFMEAIIMCSSFKTDTIKEWLKTAVIVSLIVMARLLPYLIR